MNFKKKEFLVSISLKFEICSDPWIALQIPSHFIFDTNKLGLDKMFIPGEHCHVKTKNS